MTLQEAKKQLEYIKIKVNNESEKVQKLLFKAGFQWFLDKQIITNKTKKYIYTTTSDMFYGNREYQFEECENNEVTIEELEEIIKKIK